MLPTDRQMLDKTKFLIGAKKNGVKNVKHCRKRNKKC